MARTVHLTACPRNCYSTCAMRVTVQDGRLVAVEPADGNLATAESPCLKGLSYVERQHHPDRIVHPLRRDGGRFVRIGWDEALDEITGQLMRTRDRHGPLSVLYYSASGTKGLLNRCGLNFWRRFGGCTTTYGDLCWPAGLEATRLTLGANIHNAPWDLANARLIIFWGKNTAETNIHQMNFVDQALDRGAQLVVVDPRRTQTAQRAGLLVQPRPGTDGFLALATARLLRDRGHVDGAFVGDRVLGYDRFAAMLDEVSVADCAATCGVPVAVIEKLAELLGTVRPATICAGFGMQRYTNSGQTMRAVLALLALTGNFGRPGAGWIYANLQTEVFGGPGSPFDFFPPSATGGAADDMDGNVRVGISTARLGVDMARQQDPPLKFAWVERGNPLSQNPDTAQVRDSFRALDFRVVVEQFLTDTAGEADIVLPAKSMFEQTDVMGAYWHPYLQLRPKVLDPPAEVLPETEIYRRLAQRLDLEVDDLIPGPDDTAHRRWLDEHLAPLNLDLDAFAEGPVLVPGHREVVFADGHFPTPSGRIELYSAEAARRWGVDPLPRVDLPEESAARGAGAYPLQLLTPNTRNRIHSQFGNLELIKAVAEPPRLQMHPDDAAARGLGHGDTARVFNGRGDFTVPVHIDGGIRQGCVSVTNGWWQGECGPVNLTSLGRETDMAFGSAFHDNLVEVERAAGP
jgi:anaerobic selenocysteine-containing dehydrogenase